MRQQITCTESALSPQIWRLAVDHLYEACLKASRRCECGDERSLILTRHFGFFVATEVSKQCESRRSLTHTSSHFIIATQENSGYIDRWCWVSMLEAGFQLEVFSWRFLVGGIWTSAGRRNGWAGAQHEAEPEW